MTAAFPAPTRRQARAAILAATLAATVAGTLAPLPARAHAILIASTPAVNGSVPAGSLAIALHYNSRIDAPRSRVTLAGPGDTGLAGARRLPIRGDGDSFLATASVRPGAYLIRWQALALDGHITRGEVPFTVTPAGAPAPGATPDATPATPPSAAPAKAGTPTP